MRQTEGKDMTQDDAACIERIAAALYADMYNRSWDTLEEWAKPQWRRIAKIASDAARTPDGPKR